MTSAKHQIIYSSLNVLLREFFEVHGPLARYLKLRVAHAPEMPGTFSPLPRPSDPDMRHGTCVTHVPWRMSGSLTSCSLWSQCRGKRSQHSRRMRNPQFYVSGKRPMCDSTDEGSYQDGTNKSLIMHEQPLLKSRIMPQGRYLNWWKYFGFCRSKFYGDSQKCYTPVAKHNI